MKQSKIKNAEDNVPKKDTEKRTDKPESVKEKKSSSTKQSRQEKKDAFLEFNALEWHVLTLAGSKMDENDKKQRVNETIEELKKLSDEIKASYCPKLGLSEKSVDLRLALAAELAKEIMESGKSYATAKDIDSNSAAQASLSNYEACEWSLLEQGIKAKDAATTENEKKQASEQEKLFNSSGQYVDAACNLANQSDTLGIPKEIVQMRTEQRLKHLGNDPDLKDMRNPEAACTLSGGAAFIHYVKELLEKLAKAIQKMMSKSAPLNETETVPLTPQTQQQQPLQPN